MGIFVSNFRCCVFAVHVSNIRTVRHEISRETIPLNFTYPAYLVSWGQTWRTSSWLDCSQSCSPGRSARTPAPGTCRSIQLLIPATYFMAVMTRDYLHFVNVRIHKMLPNQHQFFYSIVPPTKYLRMHVEYRAVSGVFQNIDPHPLSTQRGAGRGGTHSPGGEGVGVNILHDARHRIGLTV